MFGSPSTRDWQLFQKWADLEGWRVPAAELTLYRNELAGSACVLRDAAAGALGFVTVCRHRRSGWIGNLIVDPARRGQGLGRRLFLHAAELLAARGAETLWLTASPDGRPLYESCGFRQAGTVERWTARGAGDGSLTAVGAGPGAMAALITADAAGWGDDRSELLRLLARDGTPLAADGSTALLQAGERLRVLGPWLSPQRCPRADRQIVAQALGAVGGGAELAVDLIGGSPAQQLLHAAGFRQAGETVLMRRGAAPSAPADAVAALATLGSMG